MDIMNAFDRGINVILKPKETFNKLKLETISQQNLIIYLAIIGLPTLIGVIIGYGVVGFGGSYQNISWSYNFSIGTAVAAGIIQYILMVVGIIVFGYIFNFLAPTFKSKQNLNQALKLTAFAASPVLLAGIFNIYAPISILVLIFAIYSLYLLYLGIPIFMETPDDQHIPYLIVSIIIYFVIIFVIGMIVNNVMWAVVGGQPTPTVDIRPPLPP